MTGHLLAAMVCLAAVLLYADRSAYLETVSDQRWAARLTRVGIWLWMVSNCVAFVDLATREAPFEWRHWLVLGAMSLSVAGHLGLKVGHEKSPTK